LKKIDLHIHTIATISDRGFEFSIDTFKRYASDAKLDAVAVTNHDVFNAEQYHLIKDALPIVVFPGIEINIDLGHLLVIARPEDVDDFNVRAAEVSKRITRIGDSISVDELIKIFGNLDNYLLLPHYDKRPAVAGETLGKLLPYISAGEVDSPKKFIRNFKDPAKLTPVLFSDSRMAADFASLPTRQTFVDCGELTLEALKACLKDKAKVALSERDGNRLWQVFDNGQQLSTGLNVLIGARSSGKSYTLDRISDEVRNTKYIRQFELVQHDPKDDEREFTTSVERRRSIAMDQHLAGLKRVLDQVVQVDLAANDRRVEEYVSALLRCAEETDKRDAFSNAALFDEVAFPLENPDNLEQLVRSVQHLIENVEHRPVIEKHVDRAALKRLACELIDLLRVQVADGARKKIVNELVKDIKQGLSFHTSASQVPEVDLYAVSLDRKKVTRFSDIVEAIRKERVISEDVLQGFKIEARSEPYSGAGEVKSVNGTKAGFSDAFKKYKDPYAYLCEVRKNDDVAPANYYKLFAKISCRILNKDGYTVSGGERSEFRLLQEIADARNYDLLLIDEPESSFDNLFLKSDVNQILKSISETMPVVVVTHNSTVGASIGADYVLFSTKTIEDHEARYRIFSGYPTDKTMTSIDGKVIASYETLLDSLEAGALTYEKRKEAYEAVKDR
jgi:hypothetical protein